MKTMTLEEFKEYANENSLLEKHGEEISYYINILIEERISKFNDAVIKTPVGEFYFSIRDWEIGSGGEYVNIEFSYNYEHSKCAHEKQDEQYKELDTMQKIIVDGVSEVCGLEFFENFYVRDSRYDEIQIEDIEVLESVLRKNYLKKTVTQEFEGSFKDFIDNIYFYGDERIEGYEEMVESAREIFLYIKREIEDLILTELSDLYWDENIAYEYLYNLEEIHSVEV